MRIVCESYIKSQEATSKVKTLFALGKKDKNGKPNDDDEDDAMDEEEEMRMFQRSRRGNRAEEYTRDDDDDLETTEAKENSDNDENITHQVIERIIRNKAVEDNDEDFQQSPKFYFGKYYMLIMERLQSFLQDETNKLLSTGSSIKFMSSSPFSNNFNGLIKTLKAHLFLANNLQHLIEFADNLSLLGSFKKIDPNFESSFRAAIDSNTEKACELFVYLNSKWEKVASLNFSGGGLSASRKSQSFDDEDNEERDNALGEMKKSSRFRLGSTASSTSSSKRNSDAFDKISLKSASTRTAATSGFKFPFGDSKKKRMDEFTTMLREAIITCIKLLIDKKKLATNFRNRIMNQIGYVLQYFESTGELKQWTDSYSIKAEVNMSLTDKLVETFFSGLVF